MLTKSFANTVVISGSNLPFGNTYLNVGHDSNFGAVSNRPMVVFSLNSNTTAAETNEYKEYQLALHNESNTLNSFSGIVFKNGSTTNDADNYGAAIKAINTDAATFSNESALTFWVNDNNTDDCKERMRITEDGDVGIGTAGPSSRLDVEHTTTAFDYISIVNSTAALDTVKAFAVQREGSERLVIHSNGDVDNTNNSYGALSDSRLKENIITGSSQWNDIKNLKFKNFNLIGNDLTQLGVLAQDLEASGMSGLVNSQPATESHIALNSELDGESVKSVKYSILNLKAIKALQEAMDKIESLEQRITTLENN